MEPVTPYSFRTLLSLSMEEAEVAVRAALSAEGFGVLTEIDIAATLQKKLGIIHPPHKILGACNPQIAYGALQGNPDVALALPCNVVLRGTQDATEVSALLPGVALQPFQGLKVQESSCTAHDKLSRVFDTLSKISSPSS